eukprot:scaffold91036_cov45-Phaeocystis_antarctica.AAC.1
MSIVRSMTCTLPSSARCRLRPWPGVSSSSKTTQPTPRRSTSSAISSTLPLPMKVDGLGCCMFWKSRPTTSSPAVAQRRASSSSDSLTSQVFSSVLYLSCLMSTPIMYVFMPGVMLIISPNMFSSAMLTAARLACGTAGADRLSPPARLALSPPVSMALEQAVAHRNSMSWRCLCARLCARACFSRGDLQQGDNPSDDTARVRLHVAL